MKHTQGPWLVEPDEASGQRDLVIVSPSVGCIIYLLDCEGTDHGQSDDPQAWADARLIAAAPELLAALKDMLAGYEDTMNRYGHGAGHADQARAAIAKALAE